jgi:hypothetical protein
LQTQLIRAGRVGGEGLFPCVHIASMLSLEELGKHEIDE